MLEDERVKRFVGRQNSEDDVEQFAHHGRDDDFGRFAGLSQTAGKAHDQRVAAHRPDGREVEMAAQPAGANAADATPPVDGRAALFTPEGHRADVPGQSGGQGDPVLDTAQAISVMLEKHGVACDMMHGFNWSKWTTGKPAERLQLIPAGQEHILEQEDGKGRWLKVVMELSRAFALCAASDEATAIRDDVSFFQALQAALNKQSSQNRKSPEQIDAAIRQLVSKAITTDGQVIDVFTAAGLSKPDISILSDQFLAEVRGLKHKNVAAELLEKLLKDELKVRSKRNLVQSQVFSEKLKKTLNAYHNRAISTMQVIEELIKLAKDLDAATKRGEDLGLTDDEVAFYDALATNDSAKQAMGDDKLKVIATELITQVKKSVTIDWTLQESARARIKVMVKRILNRHGYPPDLQEEAVKTVLKQAELLCAEWV